MQIVKQQFNQSIESSEDSKQESSQSLSDKLSQLSLPSIPAQSKIHKQWKQVQVTTNLFQIDIEFQNERYNYEIQIFDEKDIEVQNDNRVLKNQVYTACKQQIIDTLGPNVKRGNNIYCFKKITDKILSFKGNVNKRMYIITLVYADTIYLDDTEISTSRGNKITQLFNSITKQAMLQLQYKEYGYNSKFYDPKSFSKNLVYDDKSKLGLLVGKGFYITSQISQGQPLLLIDSCCKIIRQQTALDFIMSYSTDEEARDNIIDQTVKANYGNEKTYTILDLELDMSPMTTFDYQGKKISYIEYFQNRYQVKIQDKKQPLIKTYVRNLGFVYLVPELVQMTGLTKEMQKNRYLMKDLSKITQKQPNQKIIENKQLMMNLEPQLQEHGIQIKNKLNPTTITGYQIPKPKITIGNKVTVNNRSANFQIEEKYFQTGKLQYWILIYPSEIEKEANEFLDCLIDLSIKFQIQLDEPILIAMQKKDKNQDWLDQLELEISKKKNYQFIVSFLKQENSKIYHDLKNFLLIKKGIAHQNVLLKSMNKNKISVCSNILMQMNTKLGNSLWTVEKPEGVPKVTMVVGIDVFHHKKNQSVAGFVASVDPYFTKFYYKFVKQAKKGSEELVNLNVLMKDALINFWNQTNGKFLPECIIVYRDGVGDSQIQQTVENEIQLIRSSFQLLFDLVPDYKPQFTYILVNKRINQRLFIETSPGSKQYNNPESGTVVLDKIVVSNFDFFLVAQNTNQGTCTPTHYTVCHNDTQMDQFTFIQMTYFQTFNYYNWKGPVRVPGVVMYAHKLAFIAGQTLKDNVNENLQNKNVFL